MSKGAANCISWYFRHSNCVVTFYGTIEYNIPLLNGYLQNLTQDGLIDAYWCTAACDLKPKLTLLRYLPLPIFRVSQETCYDYLEKLNARAKCEVSQGVVQVDDSNPGGAACVELLHDASVPTPEPSRLSPSQGNQCVSHGEEDGSDRINDVATDGDIEIEMLSTSASSDPVALEEAVFSLRETIDMEISLSKSGDQRMSPPSSLGIETSTDEEFPQVDSRDGGGKMSHTVCSPVSCTKSHDMDAAEEIIDAEDWLEAIDAFHWS